MPKVRPHLIDKKEKYKVIGRFFEIVSNLKSKKEVIDFFVGLLTSSESLMFARRIQIAEMLLEGDNYERIRKVLKVSNQTITKTDQWLHSGDENYGRWLEKCLKIKANLKDDYSTGLDRYAHHRFFKDLLK